MFCSHFNRYRFRPIYIGLLAMENPTYISDIGYNSACKDPRHLNSLHRFTPSDFEGDDFFCVFATPQMLSVFYNSEFVELDVTYPGIQGFPYLLNMVLFNISFL